MFYTLVNIKFLIEIQLYILNLFSFINWPLGKFASGAACGTQPAPTCASSDHFIILFYHLPCSQALEKISGYTCVLFFFKKENVLKGHTVFLLGFNLKSVLVFHSSSINIYLTQ